MVANEFLRPLDLRPSIRILGSNWYSSDGSYVHRCFLYSKCSKLYHRFSRLNNIFYSSVVSKSFASTLEDRPASHTTFWLVLQYSNVRSWKRSTSHASLLDSQHISTIKLDTSTRLINFSTVKWVVFFMLKIEKTHHVNHSRRIALSLSTAIISDVYSKNTGMEVNMFSTGSLL